MFQPNEFISGDGVSQNGKRVGRKRLLTDIQGALTLAKSNQAVITNLYKNPILTGMPGVGKTTLAAQYCLEAQLRQDYDLIYWIKCGPGNLLETEFENFAKNVFQLEAQLKSAKSNIDIVKSVYKSLDKVKRWLLVFDNATSYQQIANYLPRTHIKQLGLKPQFKRHVLITSRSTKWDNKKIYVDTFTEEEAQQFAQTFLEEFPERDCMRLAEKLGYHPLAMIQAHNYIRCSKNTRTVAEYLNFFTQESTITIDKFYITDYERHSAEIECTPYCAENILKALSLSVELYQDWAKQQKHINLTPIHAQSINTILGCLTYLDGADIPIVLLKHIISISLNTAYSDAITEDFLEYLTRFLIVRPNTLASPKEEKSTTVNIHKLMQQALKLTLQGKKHQVEYIVPILLKALEKGFDYAYYQDSTIIHTTWVYQIERILKLQIKPHNDEQLRLARARLLAKLGTYYLFAYRQYTKAKHYYQQAKNLLTKMDRFEHAHLIANINNGLGFIYYINYMETDNSPTNKQLAATHLENTLRVLGDSKTRVTSIASVYALRTLGYISEWKQNHSTAKKYYQRCLDYLKRQESDLLKNEPEQYNYELGIIYHAFGNTHINTNKYREALAYYLKAYQCSKSNKQHPDLLGILATLTREHLRDNNPLEAMQYAKQAQQVASNLFGAASVDTIKQTYQIAACHQLNREFKLATATMATIFNIIRENTIGYNDAGIMVSSKLIHIVAEHGDLKSIQWLSEASNMVCLHAIDRNGDTPLHLASAKGHLEVVKFLLQQGADPTIKNKYKATALSVAAYHGHCDTIKLLISSHKNTDAEVNALYEASAQGHLDVVFYLLQNSVDSNAKSGNGYTPLYAAAWRGQLNVVECLLQHSADISIKNNNNTTALHAAASQGHLAIIKRFFAANSQINANATDKSGLTPLHMAGINGHLDVVEYLLQQGANVAAKDNDGDTALHLAAQQGHLAIVEYLIAIDGKHINSINQSQATPLYLASINGHLNVVKHLLTQNILAAREKGIETEVESFRITLYLATLNGHLQLVQHLLQEEYVVFNNEIQQAYTLLLYLAAIGQHFALLRYLLTTHMTFIENDKIVYFPMLAENFYKYNGECINSNEYYKRVITIYQHLFENNDTTEFICNTYNKLMTFTTNKPELATKDDIYNMAFTGLEAIADELVKQAKKSLKQNEFKKSECFYQRAIACYQLIEKHGFFSSNLKKINLMLDLVQCHIKQDAYSKAIALLEKIMKINYLGSEDAFINAKNNLREFAKELGLDNLFFDANNTCILGIDDAYSVHITYEPASKRLYLYSPLLDGLPKDIGTQLRLYQELLQGSMLGGGMAGGGVGVAVKEELILIHRALDMTHATPDLLRCFMPLYVQTVEKWRAICENIKQQRQANLHVSTTANSDEYLTISSIDALVYKQAIAQKLLMQCYAQQQSTQDIALEIIDKIVSYSLLQSNTNKAFACAKANLAALGKELNDINQNLGELTFDENNSCILGIDDAYSIHITYEPISKRLYLYSPLLDGLPKDMRTRLRLYQELLQGSMLGGNMAGGGVGVAVEQELILIHCTLDMTNAAANLLLSFLPLYVKTVEKWRAVCDKIKQQPVLDFDATPEQKAIVAAKPRDTMHYLISNAAFQQVKDLKSDSRSFQLSLQKTPRCLYGAIEIKDFLSNRGDSLFSAVAKFTSENANTLRALVVENLQQDKTLKIEIEAAIGGNQQVTLRISNGSYYPYRSFAEYIKLMSRHGTWGTMLEVKVLAKLLQRAIVVFTPYNQSDQIINQQSCGNQEPILLNDLGFCNYQPLSTTEDITNSMVLERVHKAITLKKAANQAPGMLTADEIIYNPEEQQQPSLSPYALSASKQDIENMAKLSPLWTPISPDMKKNAEGKEEEKEENSDNEEEFTLDYPRPDSSSANTLSLQEQLIFSCLDGSIVQVDALLAQGAILTDVQIDNIKAINNHPLTAAIRSNKPEMLRHLYALKREKTSGESFRIDELEKCVEAALDNQEFNLSQAMLDCLSDYKETKPQTSSLHM